MTSGECAGRSVVGPDTAPSPTRHRAVSSCMSRQQAVRERPCAPRLLTRHLTLVAQPNAMRARHSRTTDVRPRIGQRVGGPRRPDTATTRRIVWHRLVVSSGLCCPPHWACSLSTRDVRAIGALRSRLPTGRAAARSRLVVVPLARTDGAGASMPPMHHRHDGADGRVKTCCIACTYTKRSVLLGMRAPPSPISFHAKSSTIFSGTVRRRLASIQRRTAAT